MTTAAIQARHLTLARLERAAGESFGCVEEGGGIVRGAFVTPTSLALMTLVAATAATIGYLV
ncbi:hypothetical protein [uncultured Methylobacterium sp.]|uniref:hypothetical protein n=1 Tax=uncultured Methylobacterium sp. TaxID=157278 RepID=UPI0035CAA659